MPEPPGRRRRLQPVTKSEEIPGTELVYTDHDVPGITRQRLRRGWAYYDPQGRRIADRQEIDRLNRIGLPPAYEKCWFCGNARGHLQAVGYDARGRRQYRYHPDFREARETSKYEQCAAFGRALPRLRRQVRRDLARGGADKAIVCAAVVRLLDLGRVRVGNEAYRKANRSFGATTLRSRHASVSRQQVRLEYRGKSGRLQQVTVADRRLARIVKRCQDLPGQTLFQFLDEEGARHPVTSADINAYIGEAMGEGFTAKHFRTWGASVIAFAQIIAAGKAGPSLKPVLDAVAHALGNTAAIARKSYVHPALVALAKAGQPITGIRLPRATQYLSRHERGLISFLEEVQSLTDDGKTAGEHK